VDRCDPPVVPVRVGVGREEERRRERRELDRGREGEHRPERRGAAAQEREPGDVEDERADEPPRPGVAPAAGRPDRRVLGDPGAASSEDGDDDPGEAAGAGGERGEATGHEAAMFARLGSAPATAR
jgi:hypothetical protein